jgi:hypothetical protein
MEGQTVWGSVLASSRPPIARGTHPPRSGQIAFLLSFDDMTDPANPELCFSIVDGVATPGAGMPPYSTYLAFPAEVAGCAAEGFLGVQGGVTGPNGVIANVFWWTVGRSFGSGCFKGILAVATLVSVVGSQAMITGVGTILAQASALGLFPFIKVKHTSAQYEHQVRGPSTHPLAHESTS